MFERETIYEHMHRAHGGIEGGNNDNENDYAEQVELLRQAAEARRVAEEVGMCVIAIVLLS